MCYDVARTLRAMTMRRCGDPTGLPMFCSVVLHAFDARLPIEESVVVERGAPVMVMGAPAEPIAPAGEATRPVWRVHVVMHDGPMAMVMSPCMHVDVKSRAVQAAVMTARSVMATRAVVTRRSMMPTCSMVTTMRLRTGRGSQADGARQNECDQESSNDASHVVLLRPRVQVLYSMWQENTVAATGGPVTKHPLYTRCAPPATAHVLGIASVWYSRERA